MFAHLISIMESIIMPVVTGFCLFLWNFTCSQAVTQARSARRTAALPSRRGPNGGAVPDCVLSFQFLRNSPEGLLFPFCWFAHWYSENGSRQRRFSWQHVIPPGRMKLLPEAPRPSEGTSVSWLLRKEGEARRGTCCSWLLQCLLQEGRLLNEGRLS